MSKRICPVHGIWEKKSSKDRCPKCKKMSTHIYDKSYRNKEADKFYHSREWRRVRGLKLSRDPLCVMCGRPAKIVDHIKEISDGGCKLCLDNLQSMCVSCHNSKTADERSTRGGEVKSLHTDDGNTEPPSKFSQKQFSGGTLE